MKDNEQLITEDERLRIAAIDDVKARQESTEEYRLYRRIQEDKKAATNYENFNVQCKINEILNKLVRFVKNYHDGSNESYKILSGSSFCELIEEKDFKDYVHLNIIPTIDTEVIDKNDVKKIEARDERRNQLADVFYKNDIEYLRKFLYYCHGLSPLSMPRYQSNGSIDVLECIAAGINPEAYIINNNSWFLEQKDYSISDISSIIINGEINGIKTASKVNKQDEVEGEEIRTIKAKKY